MPLLPSMTPTSPGARVGLLVPLVAAALLIPALPRHSPAAPASPTLVVLVVVDQMRGDYLQRFHGQWTGGFARLLLRGAVFPAGMQDHAITETAPGHATILSGRYPASTGIVTNTLGVEDSSSPLLGATGPGASPRRFVGTTLCDWLLARDPQTLVLSVARKDRAAILAVGRTKGSVFWYVTGRFTTSRYYTPALPDWIEAYNRRPGPERLAGTAWKLLLPDSAYHEPDAMAFENGGRAYSFPHPFPATAEGTRLVLPGYPWMDSLTLDLALEGVDRLGMGRRGRPDVLVVGLSATDNIGHAYGPDSRELHDQLLRVDHWLGWFLDSLATRVPADRTVLVLTADHGVVPFPEVALHAGRPAGRVSVSELVRGAHQDLIARWGSGFSLGFDSGLLEADVTALRSRGVNLDSLSEALATAARRVPGVARVYTPRSLRAAPPTDRQAVLWRRALPNWVGWLLCLVAEPGFMFSEQTGLTTHGTTNPDDVQVPIAFLGAGIHPGVYERAVSTVDIAPTLAALLGVKPAGKLDGRVIGEVVKHQ